MKCHGHARLVSEILSSVIVSENKRTKIFRWFQNGGFAILDQGFFAGTNFLVLILLARWMDPEQFGAYTVSFYVFQLVGAFHTSVLTQPMLTFGVSKYSENFSQYLGILFYAHWRVTIATGLMLGLVGLIFIFFDSTLLGMTIAGMGMASPLILLLWLMRRAFYITNQPGHAATGSGLYFLFVCIGFWVLFQIKALSPFLAFVTLGIGAVPVCFWCQKTLKAFLPKKENYFSVLRVYKSHWMYGKWMVGNSVVIWLSKDVLYIMLPFWWGLESSGALQALTTLVRPVHNLFLALSNLLHPLLGKMYYKEGIPRFIRTTFVSLAVMVVAGLLYTILLLLFGQSIFDWLYVHKYSEVAHLLPIISLIPLCWGVNVVLSTALRVTQNLKGLFSCYFGGMVMSATLGLYYLVTTGLSGAAMTMVLSLATTASMLMITFWILFYSNPLFSIFAFFMRGSRFYKNDSNTIR